MRIPQVKRVPGNRSRVGVRRLVQSGAITLLMVLALPGFATQANAALTNDPYPAPGGNAASCAGTIISAGGMDCIYSSFDFSAFSTLYFVTGDWLDGSGTFDPTGPMLSMDSTPDTLSYNAAASNLASGRAYWIGTTSAHHSKDGGNTWPIETVNTRLLMSVADTMGNPLALTDATSITGMPVSVGAAYEVADDFNINWFAEAKFTYQGTWQPAGDFFDGLESYAGDVITHSVGEGFYYNPLAVSPIGFTITSYNEVTSEDGTTDVIEVELNSMPANTVTIPVSSSDTTEGTVDKSSLIFTPSDWSTAQTITVTGVDDLDVDGDQSYNVILGIAVSNDTDYNGLNPADVTMSNLDDDVPPASDGGGGGGGGCNTVGPAPGDPLWPDVFWIALLTTIFFLRRRINIRR